MASKSFMCGRERRLPPFKMSTISLMELKFAKPRKNPKRFFEQRVLSDFKDYICVIFHLTSISMENGHDAGSFDKVLREKNIQCKEGLWTEIVSVTLLMLLWSISFTITRSDGETSVGDNNNSDI
uniref:Uncharacterized protein n=1 Tax=Romanomermis culicivorax TaxID=13658 RepID=A0A915IXM4_ROMCU